MSTVPCVTDEKRERILCRLMRPQAYDADDHISIVGRTASIRVPTEGELKVSYAIIDKKLKNFMKRALAYNIEFSIPEVFVTILLQPDYWFRHTNCNVFKSPSDYVTFWDHACDLSESGKMHRNISLLVMGRSGSGFRGLYEDDLDISKNVSRYNKDKSNCTYAYLLEKGIITYGVDNFMRNISEAYPTDHSYISNRIEEMAEDPVQRHMIPKSVLDGDITEDFAEMMHISHMKGTACIAPECIALATKPEQMEDM